jgi:hypothetical protein
MTKIRNKNQTNKIANTKKQEPNQGQPAQDPKKWKQNTASLSS